MGLGPAILGETLGGAGVAQPWTPSSPPAGYLNVLVNSQWKSRWCSVRDSHLHFFQDRNRSKVAQQPVSLLGCEVVPDPSPDHLYSFRILHHGEELAKLEVLLPAGGGPCCSDCHPTITVIPQSTIHRQRSLAFFSSPLHFTSSHLKKKFSIPFLTSECLCYRKGTMSCFLR